jgi:glycerophosphoryl diester phosphodiesterase
MPPPLTLPRWLAHRGGGSLAPENTLAGIRLAAQLGFKAVEFDVMLSRDGTPILMHDETLERTTNGVGSVCQTADAVLFALDAGQGEAIPRFEQAARLCRQLGLLANVEIKPATGFASVTAETVARLSAELWRDAILPPLLSSFSLEALAVARDIVPQFPRGVLFDAVPAHWLEDMRRLEAISLHCDGDLLTDARIAEVRAEGFPLLCYTVNSEKQAKNLRARGVSAMFTDRLDLFAAEAGFFF